MSDEAEAAAKALAEAGAAHVYLAGKPGADQAALEQGRHWHLPSPGL